METMNQLSIKNIRPVLLVLILIIRNLLTPCIIMAQEGQTTGPLPAETILLTTDRSLYLSGEMVYLSATILEADNFKVSKLSRITRVELLDSEGKTGIRDIFYSDNGNMTGTIKLPDNLSTGWYRLRAYTSWMRNQGPSLFSYRDVRIINPFDAVSLNEYVHGSDTLMVSVISGTGTALTGVPNHCAVRSVTRKGRPMAVKGALVSSGNDTITDFSTGETGWGTLIWTPETGEEYHIAMESNPGIPVITTIPQHSENTVYITIADPLFTVDDPSRDRNLTVTLRGNIPETGIKLLVHRISSWYIFDEAVPVNGKVTFRAPTDNFPDGILAFSFLSNDNSLITSTLWFKGNVFAESGFVATETFTNESVTDLVTEYRTGENSEKGFYTLITGRCEPFDVTEKYIGALPGWYSTWDIPVERDERQGWMIANGYERSVAESFFKDGESSPSRPLINYRDVTDTREALVEFVPETRGIKISGKATVENGKPAGFHKLSLTSLTDNLFITTRIFSDGRFHFTIPGKGGSKDLILSHAIRPITEMSLSVDSEFDQRLSGLPPDNIYLTDEEKLYINGQIIDSRLDNIYRDTSVSIPVSGEKELKNTDKFYGNPDRVIYIDDYIKLPDMREVIFEVVPFVNVKKDGDDYSLNVIGETPFPRIYDPLILIDGIPLLSYSKFLELPPERFERIDVIYSLYIHGNQIFAGVVNFISVNGDLAGLDLPEGSRIVSLDIPYDSPSGELVTDNATGTEMPSFESTLSYINLLNTAEGSITYRRNPVYGDYMTILTGINKEGKWVSASSRFEIRGSYRNN